MPKRERSSRLTGKFSSIEEMVRLRGLKGFSQKDGADRLGCTPGWVSKMESSADVAVAFGDLLEYASALGYRLEITLMPERAKTVDRVKFHAMHIKKLINRLAGLAARDPAIAAGASPFFGEAAFNFLLILQEAADRPPKSVKDEKEAALGVEVCGPTGLEGLSPAPKRVRKRKTEEAMAEAEAD